MAWLTCTFYIVAFGFCDYGDPEASLRAIRLLHNKALGDKALVVSKMIVNGQHVMSLDCIVTRADTIKTSRVVKQPLEIWIQSSLILNM